MANRTRGEAQLGDLTLVFDVNAMCLLEEQTGKKTGELLALMQEGVGISELRSFIWAGLQAKHPGTLQDAGDAIGEVGFESALASLEQAITAAFVSDEPKAKAANPRKAA